MGLWSKYGQPLEYGYKYSGGMGTFSSYHEPVAIYSEVARKTFFVYSGTSKSTESHLQIMVSFYDHKTHKVPKPVIVYDKMGVSDPQDNASITIDHQGYIWIFVSGRERTRPGIVFKSEAPYSIESFKQLYKGELILPQPWWISDSCMMLLHTEIKGERGLYWSKTKDGKIWSESKPLAFMGGGYQLSAARGKRLITVFNYFPGKNHDKRTNIYFLQTDDAGETWKNIDNKVISTPLTQPGNEALVRDYESEGKLVYLQDLDFDNSGNPVILALICRNYQPGPDGNPREWMIIHWTGSKWEFNKVCESGHNYDLGALFITANDWKIIGPTEPGPQKFGTGGEMALWTSHDAGITWSRDAIITSGSLRNQSFARRPVNAHKDFYCFWVDGDPGQMSISKIYFTNDKGNRLWVLPYLMKQESEKPALVK